MKMHTTVAETVTVTGDSPIVDVQNAKRQQTLERRGHHRDSERARLPQPHGTGSGSRPLGEPGCRRHRWSGDRHLLEPWRSADRRASPGRWYVGRLGASAGSGVSYYVADVGHAQEIVFSTAGGSGRGSGRRTRDEHRAELWREHDQGLVLRELRERRDAGQQLHPGAQERGPEAPNSLINVWDTSGAFGGPIVKDRLWYVYADVFKETRTTSPGCITT